MKEQLNIPHDWDSPDWNGFMSSNWVRHVHEWKSYASDEMMDLWDTFTEEQKKVVSSALQDIADREDWD